MDLRRRSPHVLVSGYYGAGNTGDELILAGLLDGLRGAYPSARVTVLSFNPKLTERTHGVRSIYRPPFTVGAVRPRPFAWLGAARAAAQADLVIVGGGGLLEDIHNFGSVPMHLMPAAVALAMGTPVLGLGLGVGPLVTSLSRRLVRLVGNRSVSLVVRDEESAVVLQRAGVRAGLIKVGADLAFIGSETRNPAKRSAPTTRPRIGITIGPSDWNPPDIRSLAQGVQLIAERFSGEADVILFCMSSDVADSQLLTRLSSLLEVPNSLELGVRSPREQLALIGSLDVVLAGKLHGVIAAALVGTPVVALGYAPKVFSAARRLGVRSHTIERLLPGELANDVQDALAEPGFGIRLRERAKEQGAIAATTVEAGLQAVVEQGSHRTVAGVAAAAAFAALVPVSLTRQMMRNRRGNFAWATAYRRQLMKDRGRIERSGDSRGS